MSNYIDEVVFHLRTSCFLFFGLFIIVYNLVHGINIAVLAVGKAIPSSLTDICIIVSLFIGLTLHSLVFLQLGLFLERRMPESLRSWTFVNLIMTTVVLVLAIVNYAKGYLHSTLAIGLFFALFISYFWSIRILVEILKHPQFV
ncbi:hypothetical protein P9112_007585 [Eukaryota sp. TZLM1-RC]